MKKLLMVLALTLPLMAQDSTEVKEEAKQKKSWGKSVWMGVQDAEWRKYNSAHDRAHSKRGGMKRDGMDKRREMHKKRAIRSAIRILVVGGVAYYIGYHQGQHNKHPMKRKPFMGDRK